MTESETARVPAASMDEMQQGWHQLVTRVAQLEAEREALEKENKALRLLLERSIEHRQKSHSELVLLLTGLVSKLPINDVGALVSRLVEHNTNVSQYLAALIKGTAETALPQPVVLKTLDHARRDLQAAIKPVVEELIQLEAPFDADMLRSLLTDPDQFFSPAMIRANRCFIKGHVPRERVLKEFGKEALVCFNDVTTDPKLNPRPKPEEIVLAFRSDFEAIFQQNPALVPDKRNELSALFHRVQRSKAATGQAQAQKIAFQKMSFLIELLYYYEHQNTEAPDVLFAQRLPALVEQLALTGSQDQLEETSIIQAERLLAFVISPEHRLMVINNLGKLGAAGKTLKYVLKLRADKVLDADQTIADYVKLILGSGQGLPTVEKIAAGVRLLNPEKQRLVVRGIMRSDRVSKSVAEKLGKALADKLGLQGMEDQARAEPLLRPEVERQMAWARIKDLISRRTDPTAVAAAIRERLNAKYDAEEIRESWITLTEADSMSLIRIFCQLPYLTSGKTDPIARTVLEIYVTRLTHEKYAAIYHKVVNSLRNMFKAKPDATTLVNFLALVRWVSPDAADKISAEIGMHTGSLA